VHHRSRFRPLSAARLDRSAPALIAGLSTLEGASGRRRTLYWNSI
jgi:hypothetical protein